MKSYCIAALVLVGCAGQGPDMPPGEPLPYAVSDAALSEWIGRGLPAGDCVTWELRIQYHALEGMGEACGLPGWYIQGCFTHIAGLGVIIAREDDGETIQHELRHWLGACSGLGEDLEHEDERLWYGDVL